MSTSTNLREYMKSRIEANTLEDSESGYSAWLRTQQTSARQAYHTQTLAERTRAEKQKRTGARAEALHRGGLSDDGYASYLKALDGQSHAQNLTDIAATFNQADAQSRVGYASYLESEAEKYATRLASITDELTADNVTDYDTAYTYAIGAGLNEEEAKSVADNATKIVWDKLREKVYTRIATSAFTPLTAAKYAASLGFGAEDIRMFTKYAEELQQSYRESSYSDAYAEYLENLGDTPTIK